MLLIEPSLDTYRNVSVRLTSSGFQRCGGLGDLPPAVQHTPSRGRIYCMAGEVDLKFQHDGAGSADLEKEIDAALAELTDPASEASNLARAEGLDPAELSGAEISVAEDKQGIEPILTTILITIAADLSKEIVVDKFWAKVLWPRVRRKLGPTALGKRLA
jgi:hypothetical protein